MRRVISLTVAGIAFLAMAYVAHMALQRTGVDPDTASIFACASAVAASLEIKRWVDRKLGSPALPHEAHVAAITAEMRAKAERDGVRFPLAGRLTGIGLLAVFLLYLAYFIALLALHRWNRPSLDAWLSANGVAFDIIARLSLLPGTFAGADPLITHLAAINRWTLALASLLGCGLPIVNRPSAMRLARDTDWMDFLTVRTSAVFALFVVGLTIACADFLLTIENAVATSGTTYGLLWFLPLPVVNFCLSGFLMAMLLHLFFYLLPKRFLGRDEI